MEKLFAPGDLAPDFRASAIGGQYGDAVQEVCLADFRDRPVILYFYPKDDTPGCTIQACDLRDHYAQVLAQGAVVFGVSIDTIESHRKFIKKHSLPFALLSDEGHRIADAYGVWVEKQLYGKTFMGTERSTFVIRPDGRIKSIFRKVKPTTHTDNLLEDLRRFEP